MKRFLILCSLVLLAGCAVAPMAPTTPAVPSNEPFWIKRGAVQPAGRVESLLAYADYVGTLSAAEMAREYERQRLAFAAPNRSNFVRLQYAMLLIAAPLPGRDLARARQLLEPLLKDDSRDADLRRLAVHLHAGIVEVLDLDRRYREEQRRANEEQRRAGEEQRRAAELERTLEELKSIEQRIMQRDKPDATRR